ncbi:MAG: neutral/alkaline non-lysosomal ceramidase N-terminal domain-containing protein [Armatimonadetes bacterium]|nr:neutral/alkaline non-lysosomal ceramidase N-terminal domain-containing protein [Armatimonadota bacterium]
MIAGAAKADITPAGSVWMEGMIRSHKSTGVHDHLHARALYASSDDKPEWAFAIVSVDLCVLSEAYALSVREAASAKTGVPVGNIVIAATHTHSGPATLGLFNPVEEEYLLELRKRLVAVIEEAVGNARPALVGCNSGQEDSISHYRRLLSDDGGIIMNWEPYEKDRIVGPLGEPDPEVGVTVFVERERPEKTIALLFNHAGHPNVMSGENYMISADYPGVAAKLIEDEIGGTALFINGAQGSVDIDGLNHREWAGVTRAGTALADAVSRVFHKLEFSDSIEIRSANVRYSLPARRITTSELAWADDILNKTRGAVQAVEDGVGDDYLACLYKELHNCEESEIHIEQTCLAVGDTAFVTFPGELFTEIGQRIKNAGLFRRTYIIGLANGYAGYVPTREAVAQGGYEPATRRADAAAEDIVAEHSLSLLRKVRRM